MPIVRILEEYCKGCELCVGVCAKEVLIMSVKVNSRGVRVVEVRCEEACTGCMNCAVMCPDAAIEISSPKEAEKIKTKS